MSCVQTTHDRTGLAWRGCDARAKMVVTERVRGRLIVPPALRTCAFHARPDERSNPPMSSLSTCGLEHLVHWGMLYSIEVLLQFLVYRLRSTLSLIPSTFVNSFTNRINPRQPSSTSVKFDISRQSQSTSINLGCSFPDADAKVCCCKSRGTR